MYPRHEPVGRDIHVSEQDSFISEVNDAVRQDQLYGYVRKYGWIAALVVITLVGGAAWNEVVKARKTAAAEAIGDGLMDALRQDDATARADALAGVVAEGPASAVTAMMTAAAQLEAEDPESALGTLDALVADAEVDQVYRDIALFKSALIDTGDAKVQKLESLAQPGSSFRLLAEEQLGLTLIESGETDAALAKFRAILEDAEVTQSLRDRVQTLIVALGAPLDPDATDQQ